MQSCTVCKGTGKASYDETRACYSCEGRGNFPPVNKDAILAAITATKGKNKGKLRAAFPSPYGPNNTLEARRAYFVWRLSRFHGGKDMTMPITAETINRGDPYIKELDLIADEVAKANFGTDLAAARVWGRAFFGG